MCARAVHKTLERKAQPVAEQHGFNQASSDVETHVRVDAKALAGCGCHTQFSDADEGDRIAGTIYYTLHSFIHAHTPYDLTGLQESSANQEHSQFARSSIVGKPARLC